jgi:hypothetical protein
MKRFASIALSCALLLGLAASAMGAVGWCGNIWPVNGNVYTSAQNIDCYVQVWKEGVTDQPGQGPDIAAYLYYRCQGDPSFIEVPMVFNTDVGNNDEYTGTIPAGHGCSVVEFYIKVVDLTDMAECYGNDQWGNPPNFFLPITQVLARDVTVRFHLCLPAGVETSGDICVTGDHAEITNWGNGTGPMILSCASLSPKLYQIDITFLGGGNPVVNYKYRKDGCATWEDGGNHSFTIDDSSAFMDLPWVDGWSWATPDCPACTSPVDNATWGTIKAIYR